MSKEQFIPLPLAEQGFKIAEFLPTGKAWDNKNDTSTNLGALLLALGAEFSRLEFLVQTTNKELDVNFAEELLREWEISVGIPDGCFSISEDVPTRQSQVITKLRNVRLQTVGDYVELAALFGVTVQVFPGVPVGFPATDKEKRFSITVNLPGEDSGQVFPYPEFFPIPFVGSITGFIQCLFVKLKPANVQMVFQFGVNQLFAQEITTGSSVEIGTLGVLFDDVPGLFDDGAGFFDDK